MPLGDRAALRSALGATLVKSSAHWPAFATAFDVYFSLRPAGLGEGVAEAPGEYGPLPGGAERSAPAMSEAGGGQLAPVDPRRLAALVLEALRSGDRAALAEAARLAVALYAGIEPGRPVGTSYYLYRTMRGLGLDDVLGQLLASAQDTGEHPEAAGGGGDLRSLTAPLGALGDRLLGDEYRARLDELRRLVESEIRRLLAAERGAGALAKSLRRTLVEDVDFMHATREELVAMRRALWPLTRASWRLAWRAAAATAGAGRSTSVRRSAGRCRPAASRSIPGSTARTPPSRRSSSSPTSRAPSPPSPASPCTSSTRSPASSRRCAASCSSTGSTRSPRSSGTRPRSPRRSSGSGPRPTSATSTGTATTATRCGCSTSDGGVRSPPGRTS